MEFKLNRIDTDIREKIQEEIRADIVNKNNNIEIKKDVTEEKAESAYIKKRTKNKKKIFQVECIKYTAEEVEVQGENMQITDEENQKGQRINTKK